MNDDVPVLEDSVDIETPVLSDSEFEENVSEDMLDDAESDFVDDSDDISSETDVDIMESVDADASVGLDETVEMPEESSSDVETDVDETLTDSPTEGVSEETIAEADQRQESSNAGISGGSGGASGGGSGGSISVSNDGLSVRDLLDDYVLVNDESGVIRLYGYGVASDSDAYVEVSADEYDSMVLERLNVIAISSVFVACFLFFLLLRQREG